MVASFCSFFAKKEPKKLQPNISEILCHPPIYRRGGSGTPESEVEHRQNGKKNSLSRRFCLRGYAPQARPQNQTRCKNQRSALVPTCTAPEPGPLGWLSNLPSFLVAQKGTGKGRADVLCCKVFFFVPSLQRRNRRNSNRWGFRKPARL